MVEENIKAIMDTPNTYIGEAPIDVDNCQWITTSGGTSRVHFDHNTYDYPKYSIAVRGTSNEEAKQRVDAIYHKLQNYVGDGFAILISRLPRFVGRDNKYRTIYSITIEYQIGGY